MIAYLDGTAIYKDPKYLIVNVNGVGYKVGAPVDVMNSIKEGQAVKLWIYTAVREDALDLYGFLDKQTLAFFELLISISGIGPKSALGILSAASVSALSEAVITGETAYLTKIGGISKKMADKIVLELKGKVAAYDDGKGSYSTVGTGQGDVDAVEALKALGYTQKEARDALERISDKDIASDDTSGKVRAALKMLGS